VIVVWYAVVWLLGLDPYLAKTPGDVLAYFFAGPHAAENRGTVLTALGSTLADAAGGYVLGTVLALGAAVVVLFSRTVDAMFTPIAMALRSIPLVAMTPLVGLVFGRGFVGVTVLTATITFVPTFVNVVIGMRQVPRSSEDLMHAYGVSWWRAVGIRSFYALPALASSARVAIPGAILGAVLAEYLATATGLGHLIALSSINSDFAALWATVTVTTALSIILYALLTSLESVALRRLSA
jgi:sulfonate transport system permease protein